MQLVIGLPGGTHPTLHDDCPICQALKEAGEPVFTLDELGRFEVISGGGRWN